MPCYCEKIGVLEMDKTTLETMKDTSDTAINLYNTVNSDMSNLRSEVCTPAFHLKGLSQLDAAMLTYKNSIDADLTNLTNSISNELNKLISEIDNLRTSDQTYHAEQARLAAAAAAANNT